MAEEKNNRIAFVDVARFIGVVLVIVGHVVPPESSLFRFIFSFHMPLFFILSGYCFKESGKGFGPYLLKKIRTLLVPYAVFSLIGIGLAILFPSYAAVLLWKEMVLRYCYFVQPIALGQAWFLVVLFWVSLFLYGLDYLNKRGPRWLTVLVLLLITAGSFLIPELNVPRFQRLPFKLDTALMATVFAVIGYGLQKTALLEKIREEFVWLLAFLLPVAVWVLAVYGNTYVNICDCIYGAREWIYVPTAVLGSLAVIFLAKLLSPVRLFRKLGQMNLVIFGIHSFFLWCFAMLANRLTGHVGELFTEPLWIVVNTLGTLIVSAAVAFLWDFLKKKLKSMKKAA